MEWLPIETHPKNGDYFLAWVPQADPPVVVAYWAEFEGEQWLAYAESLISDVEGSIEGATLWAAIKSPDGGARG